MSAIFLLAILGAAIYLRIRSVAAEKRRRQDLRVLRLQDDFKHYLRGLRPQSFGVLPLAKDNPEALRFFDNVYEHLEAKPKRSHKKKQQ